MLLTSKSMLHISSYILQYILKLKTANVFLWILYSCLFLDLWRSQFQASKLFSQRKILTKDRCYFFSSYQYIVAISSSSKQGKSYIFLQMPTHYLLSRAKKGNVIISGCHIVINLISFVNFKVP